MIFNPQREYVMSELYVAGDEAFNALIDSLPRISYDLDWLPKSREITHVAPWYLDTNPESNGRTYRTDDDIKAAARIYEKIINELDLLGKFGLRKTTSLIHGIWRTLKSTLSNDRVPMISPSKDWEMKFVWTMNLPDDESTLDSLEMQYINGVTHCDSRVIEINVPMLMNRTDEDVFYAVLHEIAHAIRHEFALRLDTEEDEQYDDHDEKWIKIFKAMGGDGEEILINPQPINLLKNVYAFHCKHMGSKDDPTCAFSVSRNADTFIDSADMVRDDGKTCVKHNERYVVAYVNEWMLKDINDEIPDKVFQKIDSSRRFNVFQRKIEPRKFKLNTNWLRRIERIELLFIMRDHIMYGRNRVVMTSHHDETLNQIRVYMHALRTNIVLSDDMLNEIDTFIQHTLNEDESERKRLKMDIAHDT